MTDVSILAYARTRPGFDKLAPPIMSFVSGFLDSCSYLGLFGLFVAQVTGSFVVAGAQVVRSEGGVITKILAIPIFLVGVAIATTIVWICRRQGRSPLGWSMAVNGCFILGYLLICRFASPFSGPDQPAAIAAGLCALAAMGGQSGLVRTTFKGSGPTTFMTGNTTQFGVDVTEWLIALVGVWRGRPEARKQATEARAKIGGILPLIGSFLIGATLGAVAFEMLGFTAVTVTLVLTFGLAMWAFAVGE